VRSSAGETIDSLCQWQKFWCAKKEEAFRQHQQKPASDPTAGRGFMCDRLIGGDCVQAADDGGDQESGTW
jgi:hypothetical protein